MSNNIKYILGSRQFTPEELIILCSSGRGGVRGNNKIRIIKYLLLCLKDIENKFNINKKDIKILDYGAGRRCLAAQELKNNGYCNLDCYDIGINNIKELHLQSLFEMDKVYDFIYSNNVINVQVGEWGVRNMLMEIIYLLKDERSVYVANFTYILNYTKLKFKEVFYLLQEYFNNIEIIGGNIKNKTGFIYFKCNGRRLV